MRNFGLVLLVWVSGTTAGFSSDLITQPEAALWLAPAIYNGSLAALIGDASVTNPTWNVSQGGNPVPLTAAQVSTVPAGSSWTMANQTTHVQFSATPNPAGGLMDQLYTISQNGDAPGHVLPCGQEYDLFLAPNGANGGYKTPSGGKVSYRFNYSKPLSQATVANISVNATIFSEVAQNTCPLNYAGYLVAITLNSSTGPSMFYQIFFRDSRGWPAFGLNMGCPGYPNAQKQYCFSSTINDISPGTSVQAVGSHVSYNVNFYADVIKAIGYTSDPNLAHWQVTGFYMGELIQGGMQIESGWSNLVLEVY